MKCKATVSVGINDHFHVGTDGEAECDVEDLNATIDSIVDDAVVINWDIEHGPSCTCPPEGDAPQARDTMTVELSPREMELLIIAASQGLDAVPETDRQVMRELLKKLGRIQDEAARPTGDA